MQLTKELFVIPNDGKFILYAPLKRAVAEVNGDMIGLLKKLKSGEDIGDLEGKLSELRQIGIVTDGETQVAEFIPKTDYTPTLAILIPTLKCNLRCIYCYSNAGINTGKTMDFEIAKSAIDFVIGNAKTTGEKLVRLAFHGGGEPLLPENTNLVVNSLEYFRKQALLNGLTSYVSCTTNGCVSRKTLEWVAFNIDVLSISLDGPRDIQDSQRPMANGESSFSQVVETVKFLESLGKPGYLGATITSESVSRIPEIVRFFNAISPNQRAYKIEPLSECGRCKTSKVRAPSPEDFIRFISEGKQVAKSLGKVISYSGAIVDDIYDNFCCSLDKGYFCVLPDGNVSSCIEVNRDTDPGAEIFIIGRHDSDKKVFEFYNERIKKLRSRNVDNIPYCRDCIGKYHCAGECPSRCYRQSGNMFDPSLVERCTVNQQIIREAIIGKLKGGDFNETSK